MDHIKLLSQELLANPNDMLVRIMLTDACAKAGVYCPDLLGQAPSVAGPLTSIGSLVDRGRRVNQSFVYIQNRAAIKFHNLKRVLCQENTLFQEGQQNGQQEKVQYQFQGLKQNHDHGQPLVQSLPQIFHRSRNFAHGSH